ncbi:hypothetical protein FisN_22Lh238 [Fistulifera solaris]|uniref:GINS subunit domain-containing protein n=1 Tax=Fistulifera solaris TaxID=1519565 RepID=A0A1Z5JCP5_FISSO|nr:hypothetical protein FisN_22Lh238 [Fistulifera solaris]|eukprot:GAX11548.1 hypothetical protein FisN_22Lh238 [Fistulifera solaris]
MDFGRYGRELLLELKRSNAAYNDTLVSSCLQDLNLHVCALGDQVAAASRDQHASTDGKPKLSMSVRPSILLQEAAIHRNKRCLLTYHWVRLQRIQKQYWSPRQEENEEPQQLGPAEEDFLQAYQQLHQRYAQNTLPFVDDLRAHAGLPPLNTERVLLRVVTAPTEGPVVLASGVSVEFRVGATHFLPWNDVEEWVRKGHLRVLTGEEHNE